MDRLLPVGISRDKSHPIFNFFMNYYHFQPSMLRFFSPGLGVMVGTESDDDYKYDLPKKGRVIYNDSCVIYDPKLAKFCEKQVNSFKKTLRILEATQRRPPNLHCYGLHEWAMLYSRSVPFITQSLPLRDRLSNEVIREVVETQGPTCTHYDAFRFFSQDAVILNSTSTSLSSKSKSAYEVSLTRDNEEDYEQPGCLHSIMDIFKWSVKIFPFLSSNLVVDALELALRAREVDMRASPYNLKAYKYLVNRSEGMKYDQNNEQYVHLCEDFDVNNNNNLGSNFNSAPIMIETVEGRREYAKLQRNLYMQAKPIRDKLIMSYKMLLDAL